MPFPLSYLYLMPRTGAILEPQGELGSPSGPGNDKSGKAWVSGVVLEVLSG